MRLFQAVEIKEGMVVQFVGVYALRWRPEWGEPQIGFVEITSEEIAAIHEVEAAEAQAKQDALAGESAYVAGRQAEAFVEWQAERDTDGQA